MNELLESKRLAVNIAGWNPMLYLPNLFASLDEQQGVAFSVTVVDNASTDGAVRWLTDHYPHVGVLRNFRNQGFARAHNQAIALALSRWADEDLSRCYVLVTNQDMEFAPDCLRQLVSYMDENPTIAACGPKLLRVYVRGQEDGRVESERTTLIDSTAIVMTKSRRAFDRGAGEEDTGQYDAKTDVFGVSGACVMLRASALIEAKLAGEFFDEDFFAYKEDVDLAWRMQRLGMKASFVSQAVAWHYRTAPSVTGKGLKVMQTLRLRRRKSPTINFLSTRNHHWLLWKNEEWGNMVIHAPWILPYELVKACASLVSPSAFRGNLAALGGIGKMWRKRTELATRAKVHGKEMRRWFV